jgi:hypothetical protein
MRRLWPIALRIVPFGFLVVTGASVLTRRMISAKGNGSRDSRTTLCVSAV